MADQDRLGRSDLDRYETTSLDPIAAELVGISLSTESLRACYIPLAHRYTGAPKQLPLDDVLEQLRPWLESPHQRKLGHNMKYQMHAFANRGIRLAASPTMQLQSYVLEPHRNHDVDSLAERHLGRKTLTYAEVCGKGVNQLCFDEVAIDRATEYAGEDAEVTRRCTKCYGRASSPTKSCASFTNRSSCRRSRCSTKWSAPAC